MKHIILIMHIILLGLIKSAAGQEIKQTVKGKVLDKESQSPLPGATVIIIGAEPVLGASTDTEGKFIIKNVPVGRYNIRVSFMGYDELIIPEVLVGSGKEVVLNAEIKEKVISVNEIVVKATKSEAMNTMAVVSARQLSVEEASRYAGGFDDPARLASSFAGVSSNLGSNGIVIRGNAPKGLLWRMEGVEIPNPSHFANLTSMGAGAITALSSQVLANSDFYTGAFPAEYGNALSGVFDINLRTGNNEKREHTFQLGLVGIDLSSEGPFAKGKKASYLFNYRYSTFTLLAPILPPEMGKLKYQDLSFKFNFPTKSTGTFSFWGIGALDYQGREAIQDSSLWKSDIDKQQYGTDLFMSALGLSHKFIANDKTYIHTSIAQTSNGLALNQSSFRDTVLTLEPDNKIQNYTWKYTLTTYINNKFSARHTNKTGVIVDNLNYNMNIEKFDNQQGELKTFVNEKGSCFFIQAYTQSKYNISKNMTMKIGLHSQLLTINNHYSVEPRIGYSWDFSPLQNLSLSYGLHSQMESLSFYLAQQETISGNITPNRNLDFSKAHHFVISYDLKISEYAHLKVEPYFQQLFNIPVIPNSYYSLQNLESGLYFNDSLINDGKGRNIGIDITIERFLNKGYYYLLTTSLFESKYIGGDGIERNSRFNKNYVANLLFGKEWVKGINKNKIISINAKLCFMGGDYLNPINQAATHAQQIIVEDLSKAFTQRKKDAQIISIGATYRINKTKHASIWSFNFVNVLGYKELNSYYFDKTTNSVKKDVNQLVIPNLSYKIEF